MRPKVYKKKMNTVKNNNNLNPLFIGFGKQALEYARVFKYLNIDITAVFIRNLKKNQENLKKYAVKNTYTNLEKALKEKKFNCVFVFLPWNLIEKKIAFILKNTNKDIYSEKPLALSLKKILYIDNLTKKLNRKLFILYNRRYYSTFELIKKKINKKKFEFLVTIPEKRTKLITNFDYRLDGKIKYHLTSHWIDFFTSLFNMPISSFYKKKKLYFFKFKSKNLDSNLISIDYDGPGTIWAKIKTNKETYLFKTLEKVYKMNKKTKRYKILIDEKKINNFKPGILNLVKAIKDKKKIKLPKTLDLIKIYKYLQKLPY